MNSCAHLCSGVQYEVPRKGDKMQTVTASLTGQGVEAGKTYNLDDIHLEPHPWGVICRVVVSDESGQTFKVNSAQIMFDLDVSAMMA